MFRKVMANVHQLLFQFSLLVRRVSVVFIQLQLNWARTRQVSILNGYSSIQEDAWTNRGRDHLNGFGLVEAAQHLSEVSDGEGVDDEHFLGARRMHDFIEGEASRVPQRLAARRRPHSEQKLYLHSKLYIDHISRVAELILGILHDLVNKELSHLRVGLAPFDRF